MCAKVLPPAGRERAALTCERETRAARRVVQERKSRAHVAASGASGRVCVPLPAGRYLVASGQTGQGRMQAPTGMSLGIGWLAGWRATYLPRVGGVAMRHTPSRRNSAVVAWWGSPVCAPAALSRLVCPSWQAACWNLSFYLFAPAATASTAASRGGLVVRPDRQTNKQMSTCQV